MALASLLARDGYAAPAVVNPTAPREPHFEPKATSVIFLFMAGGPSQLELFDPKPTLNGSTARRSPSRSSQAGASPSCTSPGTPSCSAPRGVSPQRGQSGAGFRELLAAPSPASPTICDRSRAMETDVFNHGPAKMFRQHRLAAVRPAQHGGVGHLRHRQRIAATCPASSCCSPARAARAAARRSGRAAFCRRSIRACRSARPASRSSTLANPPGVDAAAARRVLDAVRDLNRPAARRDRRPRNRDAHRRLRNGVPHADQRPGADGPSGETQRDARPATASSRASRRSRTTACWPAGWSSAACASSSSITPTGTITATALQPRRRRSTTSAAKSISRAPPSSRT